MDTSTLAILITAKDEATAALAKVDEQLKLMATSAATASEEASASLSKFDESMAKAGETATASMGTARAEIAKTGVATDEMAISNSSKLTLFNSKMEESESQMKGMAGTAALVGGAVALYVGVKAVQAAADFQTGLTKLVVSAGETRQNLQMVGDGILKLAVETGTSTKSLSDGMYIVESAGFHGANGLTVLKAAAQGAKAENSDLATVANAVTSVLHDYNLKTSESAVVTSKLVAAVGSGKTTFQEFTGAMGAVLPTAAAAHVSLDNVTGAIASMTVHGIPAQQASENLADSIRHLQSPTMVMTKNLAQYGITASDLAKRLGTEGVTGTMQDLSQAILQHMGPAGTTLISALNQSKTAAHDVDIAIQNMPKGLQALANEYKNGGITLGDYRKEIKTLPVDQSNLMQQFASLENRSRGFSDSLKGGLQQNKTYAAALASVTGDAATFNTTLQLTGTNTDYTTTAVKNVTKATAEAGNNVKGWSEIQGTMNQKMAVAREAMSTTGIAIGTALLPTATKLLQLINDIVKPLATWIENHKQLATVIILAAIAIGTAIVAFIAVAKAIEIVNGATLTWKATLKALGEMEFNPMILVFMAIALVAILIITHWSEVKKWFTDFVKDVPKLFDRFVGDVKFYFDKLVDAITGTLNKWGDDIAKTWDDIWKKFHVPIEIVTAVLLTVFGPALAITGANAIVAGAQIAGSFIKSVVTSGIEAVISGGKMIASFVVGMATSGTAAVVNAAKITGSFIKAVVTTGAQVAITGAKMLVQGVGAAVAYAASGWAVAAAWIAANIPIVLTGLAIIALIAIIVLIVTHWKDVKKWGEEAWNGIKVAWNDAAKFFDKLWQDVIGFFKKHWKVILEIVLAPVAPIIALWLMFPGFFNKLWSDVKQVINSFINMFVDFFKMEWNGMVNIWNAITGFFAGLWNGIKKVVSSLGGFISQFFQNEWNGLVNIWNNVTGFFSGLWKGIGNTMGSVGGIISGPFKAAFNAVAHFWNDSIGKLSFKAPSWVPGIGGKGFDMPKLPYLAEGTNYFQGGLAVVGEQGPELVNLPTGSGVIPSRQTQTLLNQANQGGATGGDIHITINAQAFMGNQNDAQQFATAVYKSLQQIARQHGKASAIPNIGILPA